MEKFYRAEWLPNFSFVFFNFRQILRICFLLKGRACSTINSRGKQVDGLPRVAIKVKRGPSIGWTARVGRWSFPGVTRRPSKRPDLGFSKFTYRWVVRVSSEGKKRWVPWVKRGPRENSCTRWCPGFGSLRVLGGLEERRSSCLKNNNSKSRCNL